MVSNVFSLQIERNSQQIEAWNGHFLVMVGRQYEELFEEGRLPPVLRDLTSKSRDLERELESAPSLPGAREGTSEVCGGFSWVGLYMQRSVYYYKIFGVSLFTGLDYWTGLLAGLLD